MISQNIYISTKKQEHEQINFEIEHISKEFSYDDSSRINRNSLDPGTTIRLYLNEDARKIKLIDSIRYYCRHIPCLKVYEDKHEINIEENNWNVGYSKINEVYIEPGLYEMRLGYYNFGGKIILSNNGFLLTKESTHKISKYIPLELVGEINFFPASIDVNVTRDDVILNSKFKILSRLINTNIRNFIFKLAKDKGSFHSKKIFKSLLYIAKVMSNNKDTATIFDSQDEIISLISDLWEVNYLGKEMTLKTAINLVKAYEIDRVYYMLEKDEDVLISALKNNNRSLVLHKFKENQNLLIVNTKNYTSISFHNDEYNHVDSKDILEIICKMNNLALLDFNKPDDRDVVSLVVSEDQIDSNVLEIVRKIELELNCKIKFIKYGSENPPVIINSYFDFFIYDSFINSSEYYINTENKLIKEINIFDSNFSISELHNFFTILLMNSNLIK